MKKNLVFILVFFWVGFIVCVHIGDTEIIRFPDHNLENLIRKEIKKPTGYILKSDVEEITGLGLWESGIKDISGMENLTNLTELYLDINEITNIEPLENLTKLTRLNLNQNEVSDIEPLRNLTELTHLVLRKNKITNIEPLKNLTKLTGLYLYGNKITDYSPAQSYYRRLYYKDFELP